MSAVSVAEAFQQHRRRVALALSLLWIAFVVWGTFPAFRGHLSHFQSSYPDQVTVLVLGTVGLILASILYAWLIRPRFWPYEARSLAAFLLIAAVVLRPRAAAVVALIVVASYLAGSEVLQRCRVSARVGFARLAFATTLGLSLLACLLFALGLARQYNAAALGALLLILIGIGRGHFRIGLQDLAAVDQKWATSKVLARPWVGICTFFSAIFVCSSYAAVLAPIIGFDALRFHLPLIRTYSVSGGLTEFPQLAGGYAYRTQHFEALLTLAHVLGGDPAAQLLSFVFPCLALMLAAATVRLYRTPVSTVVLGASAAISMPMLTWSAGVVKNDFAMACFQAASIYACLRSSGEKRPGWLLLSAFLLGSSFAVKPTAIFAALPIAGVWAYDHLIRRQDLTRMVSASMCLAVPALIWPVRTYFLTGALWISGSPARALDAFNAGDPNGLLNNLGRFIGIAVDAHLSGNEHIFEAPILSPIGLILAVLAGGVLVWSRRKPGGLVRRTRWIGFGSLFYWAATMRTARYGITPILMSPLLLAPLFRRADRLLWAGVRPLLPVLLTYGFLFGLAPTLIITSSRPQGMYLAGMLSDEEYVSLSFAEYPVLRSLEGVMSQEDEVLLVGTCLVGYTPYPWKVTCCDDVHAACSAEQARRRLAEKSYNYVVLPKSMDLATLGIRASVAADERGWRSAVYSLGLAADSGL